MDNQDLSFSSSLDKARRATTVSLAIVCLLIFPVLYVSSCDSFDTKKELARSEKRLVNQIEHYSKTACIDGVTYLYHVRNRAYALAAKFGTDSKIIPCKPQSQYPIAYE